MYLTGNSRDKQDEHAMLRGAHIPGFQPSPPAVQHSNSESVGKADIITIIWGGCDCSHRPVAVDRALIHLDRCSLRAEQASRRRLQLRPQPAHTRVCLKRVRPTLRVLVHHLQQVADRRLRGHVGLLSETQVDIRSD